MVSKKIVRKLSKHLSGSFLDHGESSAHHEEHAHPFAVVATSSKSPSTQKVKVALNPPLSSKTKVTTTSTTNGHHPNYGSTGQSSAEQKVIQVYGKSTGSNKTDKKATNVKPVMSFIVVYTMIFFNGCCFTAVVPSVPFYLQILNAPPSFLGWVVSFYSVGQLFGSPLGGWLADMMSSKRILTMSSTLGFISSVIYSVSPNHYYILLARWMTGVSAGCEFATELAFIARNTTKKERTVYLATVTAVNVVGFILGPALGGLLATLDINFMGLIIDKYRGPGWLLAVMFIVDIVIVQCFFKDHAIPEIENTTKGEENEENNYDNEDTDSDDDSVDERAQLLGSNQSLRSLTDSLRGVSMSEGASIPTPFVTDSQRPPSLSLVLGLIFVQFTIMCGWSLLETITSPLAQENFDWDVPQCNMLFTFGGVVSLVAYVIFVVASKYVEDRWLIGYALILCIIGQMLAIDWLQLDWVPDHFKEAISPFKPRFITAYMIMNAGFMTGRPVTFALYSKLIGSQYQGQYLGYMVAGGSAARTLGPFFAVWLYYGIKAGINLLALFGSVGGFHFVCLILVILQWKTLLPRPSMLSIRAATNNKATEEV